MVREMFRAEMCIRDRGIFISTLNGRSFTRFNSLLIGDILSVEPGKIGLLALILLLICALWALSFNQLMLSAVHPALADSRGIRVFWQETVFSVAIAVVVTLSMTWVGLLRQKRTDSLAFVAFVLRRVDQDDFVALRPRFVDDDACLLYTSRCV